MEKERQPGLDLVRAAAIFFVIVLHGITMRGALDAALLTPVWCAKVFVRYLALSAVPLPQACPCGQCTGNHRRTRHRHRAAIWL